ncbi:MAG TPA: archaetidylserine decarboxylase [Planctomycetota bacterium]|jgi:phosphatidylserine decarboxylase|nr:archaetidylserine decarboxylase [Planctomycetota bacterium]
MSSPVTSPLPRLSPPAEERSRRPAFLGWRLFPRVLATRLAGILARVPLPRFLREPFYLAYARRFGANLREAELPVDLYRTFAEFFSRRLSPNARVLDPDPAALLSPADGTVLEAGPLEPGGRLRVKGWDYVLSDLLGSAPLAAGFAGGSFVSIYLAPGDYHRFHAPATGRIVEAVRVPGTLFPVRPGWLASSPRILARNARVASVFETAAGPIGLVAVGAYNVGSVRLLYDPRLRRGRRLLHRRYVDGRAFRRGDEVGRFEFGSALLVLFPPRAVRLEPLAPGTRVRVGVRIATALR